MSSLLVTLFALLPLSGLAASEEVAVTFRVHSPGLPKDTRVYVAGNILDLGQWDPGKVSMEPQGESVWELKIRAQVGQTIEYKYTLGSWRREGASADGLPLSNLSLTVEEEVVREDVVLFWTDKDLDHDAKSQVTGTVRLHRQVTGEDVAPRDLIVWLPPDYESSSRSHPVFYMHDGQNIFDPRTSASGVDWEVDETCTRLIEEATIEPLIVVGIYNTPARNLEYMSGPKVSAYMNFVVGVVKPLIDKNYRTKPSRDYTWVGGSSAGGLCAFRMAWEHSEVFSRALCMSPAFQFTTSDGSLEVDYVARVMESSPPEHEVMFYIDNGGIGLEKRLQSGIDAMLKALAQHGFLPKQDYFWVQDRRDNHSESAWAKRLPNALRLLIGKGKRGQSPFSK